MSIHTVCTNASTVRILSQTQRLKWRSPNCCSFSYRKEVLKTLCCPISRIICTDCKLQGALGCEIQTYQEKSPEQESVYLHETFLKENFKIIDSRYFKLVTIPTDYSQFDELLLTKEFKDILTRSSFLYDVNVVENSKCFLLPPPTANHSAFDERIYILGNNLKEKEYFEQLKHVFSSANTSEGKVNGKGKATEEQLLNIISKLTYTLLNFFEKPHDYTIYHKNIVFQNNIKGVTTKGINAYVQNMYLMKLYGFLHYAKVKVEILKITHHMEDGTIRVRWRVNGVSRHRVLVMCWRLRSISWPQFMQEEAEWLDGFSVFSVGSDGLIYKHVCDKMIPDDELSAAKQVDLKSKLLGILGLSPRGPPTAGTLNTLVPYYRSQELLSCKKHS